MTQRLFSLAALLLGLVFSACAPRVAPQQDTGLGVGAEEIAFLDDLQARTFKWFWDVTDHETGLTPDRWPTRTFSSIAAIGFALPAYGVGAERGYVTREQAADRTLNTLRFLWEAPQGPQQTGTAGYKGFFYHFLEYGSGARYRGVELSTIDTALLIGGVLFSQEYFDRDDPEEAAIRAYADSLYHRIEWDFFQDRGPKLTMAWRPEVEFGSAQWNGYNEAMLMYVLALGSPSFPIEPDAWDAWTSTYTWADYYGYEHVNFTPLFGHQYSHLWIDFRGIQDEYMREKGIDYFENSRRATLSQRAYAADNPMGWKDYSADIWGLTASDGPASIRHEYNGEVRQFHTYWARGASAEYVNDDGTIVPTAAGGALPFAPDETIAVLMNMRDKYGDWLWTEYGFKDAFNPSFDFEGVAPQSGTVVPGLGWFDEDYLGIDQGPILLMAENFRSDLIWETMRKSPYLVRGLKRAGFRGGWLDALPMPEIAPIITDRQPDPDDVVTYTRRLVVLGSSTAEGAGPEAWENTFVNRLRDYLQAQDPKLDVLNLARGGYSTYHLLPTGTPRTEGRPQVDAQRNITAALARNPDVLILALTSNDSAYGYTLEEQQRNFTAIMNTAATAGVPVWITTTTPRNFDTGARQKQMTMREWIYARYGDRVVDFWTTFANPDGTLNPAYDSGDQVHMNDEAHRIMFERFRDSGLVQYLLRMEE